MKFSIKIIYESATDSEMDFNINGLSEEEFDLLEDEFDPVDYENYNGPFISYGHKGVEVIYYLLDKYQAKLTPYQEKFHPPCNETASYIMNDGRIVFVYYGGVNIFKDEKDYLLAFANRGQ